MTEIGTGNFSRSIPVLVINLDGETTRFDSVRAQVSNNSVFDLKRIRGVPGGTLPQIACDALTKTKDYGVGRGALGVFLAHVAAWEEVIKSDSPFVIVLEDDVNIERLHLISKIELPVDVDLIFLQDQVDPLHPDSHNGPVTLRPVEDALLKLEKTRSPGVGAYGYVITKKGSEKLLNACKKDLFFGHVDWRMLRYSVTEELLDATVPGTWVSKILKTHHCWDRPAWGVIRAMVASPALVTHIWTASNRSREDIEV